jgi:hypothetical protein
MNKVVKMNKIILALLMALVVSLVFPAVNAATQTSALVVVSMINQNPDPASAAGVVEIRLGVENKGGTTAENFVLEVVEQYPFAVVTGEKDTQTIGSLTAYQTGSNSEIVKFQIAVDKDASAGDYPLKIKTYTQGKESSAATYSFNVSVGSSATAQSIAIDKTLLVPGQAEEVTFKITNTGNAPLKDLTFSWENADGVILPVGSDNRNYVKYVGVGESAGITYNMMANSGATAGLYQLDLTLTYYDSLNNEEKTITSSAGMYVGGSTDFDIAFSESSSGETTFTVSNIGSNPATSVSVIIPKQSGWSTTGSNSAIVGNLNAGDYTVVSFTLQQSSSVAGNQTQPSGMMPSRMQQNATRGANPTAAQGKLKLQIQYTDTSGSRQTVEKEVDLAGSTSSASVSGGTSASAAFSNFGPGFGRMQQQSFFSKYKYYLMAFALIALAVVFGIYRHKYKKEKLVNPNFKVRDLFRRKKTLIIKRK